MLFNQFHCIGWKVFPIRIKVINISSYSIWKRIHSFLLIYRAGFHWTPSSAHTPLPGDAVFAGHDIDHAPIYVGRAFHDGDHVPAKVIPQKNVAYIAHNGQEHAKYQYDVCILLHIL